MVATIASFPSGRAFLGMDPVSSSEARFGILIA
jgi:hypothetical protein